jgi:GT2 family glycosyltransferase
LYKLWRKLPGRKKGVPKTVDLPFSTYGGLLASRELFAKIGLPKADLVLYADDAEYTLRITRSGGVLRMVTDAQLEDLEDSWHLRERKKISFFTYLEKGSDWQVYYAIRNRVWLDRHILRRRALVYSFNKAIFLLLLNFFQLLTPVTNRRNVIREAIKDGEDARLGVNSLYPLP